MTAVLCRLCFRPLGDGRRAFGHTVCAVCALTRIPRKGARR